MKSAGKGLRAGQRANSWLRDILTGRAFFRHDSHGDDSARELEELRRENREDAAARQEALKDLQDAIERLGRNQGGGRPGNA